MISEERLQELKSCIEEWIEELNTWEGPGDLYHHFLVKHGFRAEAVLEPFAAVEDSQQQLAEAQAECERLREEVGQQNTRLKDAIFIVPGEGTITLDETRPLGIDNKTGKEIRR